MLVVKINRTIARDGFRFPEIARLLCKQCQRVVLHIHIAVKIHNVFRKVLNGTITIGELCSHAALSHDLSTRGIISVSSSSQSNCRHELDEQARLARREAERAAPVRPQKQAAASRPQAIRTQKKAMTP